MNVDWQTVINTAIVGVGGTVAVSAAAAWLFRAALSEWLTRETELFKIRVQKDANEEVERLRNSLHMLATEHQVRFSRLHEKRAVVIEEVYKRLSELHSQAESFVVTSENNPSPQQKEEYERIRRILYEYSSYVDQHQIFLPEALCKQLTEHLPQLARTIHTAGVYGGGTEYITEAHARRSDAFTKAYEAFQTSIPDSKARLEAEFRKILGVELD
jgi:hypothetical protein